MVDLSHLKCERLAAVCSDGAHASRRNNQPFWQKKMKKKSKSITLSWNNTLWRLCGITMNNPQYTRLCGICFRSFFCQTHAKKIGPRRLPWIWVFLWLFTAVPLGRSRWTSVDPTERTGASTNDFWEMIGGCKKQLSLEAVVQVGVRALEPCDSGDRATGWDHNLDHSGCVW